MGKIKNYYDKEIEELDIANAIQRGYERGHEIGLIEGKRLANAEILKLVEKAFGDKP